VGEKYVELGRQVKVKRTKIKNDEHAERRRRVSRHPRDNDNSILCGSFCKKRQEALGPTRGALVKFRDTTYSEAKNNIYMIIFRYANKSIAFL